jgi:hypothetical protein
VGHAVRKSGVNCGLRLPCGLCMPLISRAAARSRVSAAAGEQNTDEPGLCFLCCAVVPSVVDVTVVTPYESQVTLKVCVAGLHQLCLLPHTNANESHLKEQEQDIQEREREREREREMNSGLASLTKCRCHCQLNAFHTHGCMGKPRVLPRNFERAR